MILNSYFIKGMCGIFGYIGEKQTAADIVFQGLKTLEYRGYDSWGIALQVNHESRSKKQEKIIIKKEVGKLPKAIHDSKFLIHNSAIAIGHTRWATHGGVTKANAHPHYDCTKQIAVLHNGIIENYQQLKDELIKKGHTVRSETDTEIIAHLLEDQLFRTEISRGGTTGRAPDSAQFLRARETRTSTDGRESRDRTPSFLGLTQPMLHIFPKLHGLNAIVAINTNTQEIVAAKNGSPLIVGIGDNEYFLSSDLTGIIPHTKKVIFIKDNELVHLAYKNRQESSFAMKIFSLSTGKELTPEIETIDWQIEQAAKGQYNHFMLKEIHEQPKIIETIAKNYTDQITTLAHVISKAKGTFFIGSGTAYHACLAGTYLFSRIAKRHVNTAPASEFTYLEDFLTKESLIIPLSQSGETIDVIEPVTRAQAKGSTIFSLVNAFGSTLYRMSNHTILLGAGPEKAVASTKAYTAKIAILTLLAYTLAGKQQRGKKILQAAAKEIEQLLNPANQQKLQQLAQLLANKQHLYLIGRGVSYATALEGALKIKEVSYIPTEGFPGGELKHGTIALIEKGTPCIVLAPQDETYEAMVSNAMEIKSRGGFMIGISATNSPLFDVWINVTETEAPLLTMIVPLQLLAYYLAIEKKLDPDKPRNLAKSVTVK